MKLSRTLTIGLAGLVLAGAIASRPASASVSFDFFYSNLSPHGEWLVSGSYGRVWQPSDYHSGWNPYYDGHWAYTDVGWCWDSDYDWGGIPYHYGTWVADPYYGWVWVPGYTWAPSWVVFRTGPGYIGWAPVRPSFSIGVSFGFGDYDHDHFVFLRSHDFLCDRVRSYAIPYSRTNVIINKTRIVNNNITVVNNVVVNHGPGLAFVERETRRRIRSVPVDQIRSVRRTVSPEGRFDRRQTMIEPQRARRGLRAADPVAAGTPLPRETRRGGFSRSETADESSRALRGERRGADVESGRAGADRPRSRGSEGEALPGRSQTRRERGTDSRAEQPEQDRDFVPPRFRDDRPFREGRRGEQPRPERGEPSRSRTEQGREEQDRAAEARARERARELGQDRMRPRREEPYARDERQRSRGPLRDEGRIFRGLDERRQDLDRQERRQDLDRQERRQDQDRQERRQGMDRPRAPREHSGQAPRERSGQDRDRERERSREKPGREKKKPSRD